MIVPLEGSTSERERDAEWAGRDNHFERAADGSEQPEADLVVQVVVVVVSTAGRQLGKPEVQVNQPEADTGNTVYFLAFLEATFGHYIIIGAPK